MAVSTIKLNGTTLMTVNDTTATASDVAQSKYFYAADGTKTEGNAETSSTALITDSLDAAGGTIRTITTTDEVHLQSSKTVTPTASTQTVLPDTGYDGFASVVVDAASGGTDFIVNLSYNDSTDTWIPDCTFTDIQAAYNAGKNIYTNAYDGLYNWESLG